MPDVTGRLVDSFKTVDGNIRHIIDPAESVPTAWWNVDSYGKKLDRNGLKITFEDQFASLDSIGPDNAANVKWFSPVRTDGGTAYGAAYFNYPGPFSIKDGNLNVRMEQVDGKWQSGHIQTISSTDKGFTQQYGVFETRMKFATTPGKEVEGYWPAFWLYSASRYQGGKGTMTEIDVIEYYGTDPRAHHGAVHLVPGYNREPWELATRWTKSRRDREQAYLTDGGWHTHTVEVTPDWVIFYCDDLELKRYPTQGPMKAPLYMMVSLALKKEEVAKAVGPMDLQVDWVKVWSR